MKELVKITVGVPPKDADKVRMAIGETGAGKIGKYSFCSYTVTVVGRFKPEEGAEPYIGEVGILEEVEEERIEVTCDKDKAKEVVSVIRANHPYEEPAIDIFPLLDLEED